METVSHVLRVLFILAEVVLLFNLLIVVHELGHFLAARWRGLVVDKFAIWFGKPIWKRTYNGVQYQLGSLPFGGFVSLPQMAPMETIEGKIDGARPNLPPVSALDKIIVAFAGPLFSFALACLFAVIVWVVGKPVSESETNLTVGYVLPGSPAAKADLQPGDRILEVDGNPVDRFVGMGESVVWYVARSEGATIPFKVKRGDATEVKNPAPERPKAVSWWRRSETRHVGILPAFTPMVAAVKPDSPAARAGLKPNDLVTAVNGQPVLGTIPFTEVEQANYNRPLALTVQRDGKALQLELPPLPFTISRVFPGSPAADAGIQPGDTIKAINGEPATAFNELRTATRDRGGAPVELVLARAGQPDRTVSVTPRKPEGEDAFYTGLAPAQNSDGISWDDFGQMRVDHPGPVEQISGSVMNIINTVGAIVSPKSDVKIQHLGGPVMIFRIYYLLFENPEGWRLALAFSVFLNVNLALLNLLPFPVLDGGHITLALVEAMRRRPMNLRVLEVVQSACALLLIGYMLFVTFFDVGDWLGIGDRRGSELKFNKESAPAAATAAANASSSPGKP